MTRAVSRLMLCGALVCLSTAAAAAQATTSSSETKTFRVIAVDGNQLVVALPEGTRELTVPSDFRFNVDGQSLSVQQLRAGMAGTATITTRTTVTPVTVTEVKNGTVRRALGTSIVVETDGDFKMFTQSDIDKRGVKIMRDGKPAQISDFRENDRLTATIITAAPPRVLTEREVNATLARNTPAAGAPAAAAPRSASASAAATPAAAAAQRAPVAASTQASAANSSAAPRTLPRTGSAVPAVGIVGLASILAGLGLTAWRRAATRP